MRDRNGPAGQTKTKEEAMTNRPTTIHNRFTGKSTTVIKLKLERINTNIKPLYVISGSANRTTDDWVVIATYTQRNHAELVLSYLEIGGAWDQHNQSFIRSSNDGN